MVAKKKLLVVDDQEINRELLVALTSDEFEVFEAENGLVAQEIIDTYRFELALVLLDLHMPVMDGLELLKWMNETKLIDSIPVIMITSEEETSFLLEAFALGASDVMNKTFNAVIVAQRVKNVINLYSYKAHLEEKVEAQRNALNTQEEHIKQMNNSLIDTLSSTVEFRNLESGKHIKRTRMLIKIILQAVKDEYGLSDEQIDTISSASALHDVGKIAIPDAVLLKPGKLTADEFEIMKSHTVKGAEVIQGLDMFKDNDYYQYSLDIAKHHHERWDGRGYPDQLKGDEIPIWAQAASIVDVYDALTSKRVYKDAFTHEKAIAMITNGECGEFNPKLMDVLKRVAPQLKIMSAIIRDEDI
ncbi:MAG: response regulator [Clostridiales Family XIII bacterium]|nr:response regulator [Clostridiales Family XIII bacterium]